MHLLIVKIIVNNLLRLKLTNKLPPSEIFFRQALACLKAPEQKTLKLYKSVNAEENGAMVWAHGTECQFQTDARNMVSTIKWCECEM